ncbi:MAG TPA: peptidoglycan-binding domain-containing protein [Pseudolabrys sp.]|nr:peptidoglycan-binding domain-containing protein [Pseudolabrys sp.]
MRIPSTLFPTSAVLALTIVLAASPSLVATSYAQGTSTPAAASTTSEATIKAVQEALNKQGIAVRADGVMNDETRNAIRKYQSQHHLPVTGDADKATLDKLGVVGQLGSPPSSTTTVGQSTSPSADHDHSHGAGGTTSGPIMQGMMQGMMQSMHGMMGMMRGQMQPDQKQSGSMPGGPMMAQQGGPMNCPMMSESNQTSGPQMMQMMQMMQGMMQMMETMQKQMQSQQKP